MNSSHLYLMQRYVLYTRLYISCTPWFQMSFSCRKVEVLGYMLVAGSAGQLCDRFSQVHFNVYN